MGLEFSRQMAGNYIRVSGAPVCKFDLTAYLVMEQKVKIDHSYMRLRADQTKPVIVG